VNYTSLLEGAAAVTVSERAVTWEDRRRYSARQGRPMTLGGLIGSFAFKGDLEPALPFLRLGELLHVGKGTSFGLGRYRLRFQEANAPEESP
jgi:CRISPR/Cas system endoribonuclease Cas6 (RAMP superfamily)